MPRVSEHEDATRRTRLANERTYLAWWRSGLTSLAVAFGAGKLVPEVSDHGSRWPFEAAGVGFGLLGLAFFALGYIRHRAVEEALDRGEYAPIGNSLALALAAAGVLLGLATVVLVFVG
jgi:putative membrane protein